MLNLRSNKMKDPQKQLLNFKFRGNNNPQESPLTIAIGTKYITVSTNVEGIRNLNLFLVDYEHRILSYKQFKRCLPLNKFISIVNRNQGDKNIIDVYADRVGELICFMHANDIVHGDLNIEGMMLLEKDVDDAAVQPKWMDHSNTYLILTDLGTCYKNSSPHAKAMNLYSLEQSMDGAEKLYPGLFGKILESYKDYISDNITEIISKYEDIKFNGPVCPRGL